MLEVPLLIIIPLLGVFFIVALARKRSSLAGIISIIAVGLLVYFLINIIAAFMNSGTIVYEIGGWSMPEGINLIVDGLSVFMLCIICFISLLSLLYSIPYMKKTTDKWKYYVLLLLLMSGINGVVLAGDIFTLFVFLEISAVASYALVSICLDNNALFGTFGYMRMGMISSVLILLGIAISYNYLSTLSLSEMSVQLGIRNQAGNMLLINNIVVIFISLLFLCGFAMKAGLVPFHFWVADAHSFAPIPVTIMLSAIIMPIAGIYPMLRIFFNVIGITPRVLSLMMVLGTLSMIMGALLSLKEKKIKKIIAYNCISEIGFVIFGIGLGSSLAIAGAFLHMISYVLSCSLLYASAGAMDFIGKKNADKKLNITFKNMPLTKAAFVVGSMSMVGIPPFNGFWSKMIIITAAWIAGYKGNCLLILIVLIVSALSFLKAHRRDRGINADESKDCGVLGVPFLMRLVMMILVVFSLCSGILWLSNARESFLDPAINLISEKQSYTKAILWN